MFQQHEMEDNSTRGLWKTKRLQALPFAQSSTTLYDNLKKRVRDSWEVERLNQTRVFPEYKPKHLHCATKDLVLVECLVQRIVEEQQSRWPSKELVLKRNRSF